MTRLCWDFDYIKYSIGSACEKRSIVVTHKQSGDQTEFDTRTAFYGHWKKKAGGWLAEVNATRDIPYVLEEFDIRDKQVAEPIEFALQTVKNHIKNVRAKVDATSYYGYIGKGDSWRVEASTIMKYKGQRANLLKPLLLPEIEEYLLTKHNASEVREIEADDKCVMDCTANPKLILCGVDKDYMGCAVTFLNVDNMEKPLKISGLGDLYLNEKGEVKGYGRKFFYFQVLSGDDSDNYKANSASTVKWGEKSAYKLLVDCKTDKECLQAVVNGYKILYPEPIKFIGWRGNEIDITWQYVMNENCVMAHMLRHENDKFELLPLLDKLKIEY